MLVFFIFVDVLPIASQLIQMAINIYDENHTAVYVDRIVSDNDVDKSTLHNDSIYSSFAGSVENMLARDEYGQGKGLAFQPQKQGR